MHITKKKSRKQYHYKNLKRNHGIDTTKEVKDLYNKTCKIMKSYIEEDRRRWKNLPCYAHGMDGGTNITEMAILPKSIYTLTIPFIKILMQFFTDVPKREYRKFN